MHPMVRAGRLFLLPGAFALLAVPAIGQSTQEAPPSPVDKAAAPIAEKAAADAIEPASIEALKQMGAYLAGLKEFKLQSDFESQMALDNDQVIDIGGTTNYEVRRPDGLKATVDSDLGSREFIYDGKHLTVVDPVGKNYGVAGVAPTIKEMLEQVSYYLDIELPLADLFNFGTQDSAERVVTEGFLVSESKVNGVPAKHWAYRTDGKDFELWIEDGDKPLPVKLVILDDTVAARPRFAANLKWEPDAKVESTAFQFTPPSDFEEIGFVMQPRDAEETKK